MSMKYPVVIQDKSTGLVYGVGGGWVPGRYRTTRPESLMVFPSETVARVFARTNFRRPEQTDQDARSALEGLDYPDAPAGR